MLAPGSPLNYACNAHVRLHFLPSEQQVQAERARLRHLPLSPDPARQAPLDSQENDGMGYSKNTIAPPTVMSATNIPINLDSPVANGLTVALFPALFFVAEADALALLELPELLEVVVAAVLEAEVDAVPAWPIVGSGAVGLTVQALVPDPDDGQGGGVRLEAEAAYADEAIPLGVKVAHWACRLVKSGSMGVGVPWRVYPSTTLLPELTVEPANGP